MYESTGDSCPIFSRFSATGAKQWLIEAAQSLKSVLALLFYRSSIEEERRKKAEGSFQCKRDGRRAEQDHTRPDRILVVTPYQKRQTETM